MASWHITGTDSRKMPMVFHERHKLRRERGVRKCSNRPRVGPRGFTSGHLLADCKLARIARRNAGFALTLGASTERHPNRRS
eukprot:1341380-Prymnesium_polylepis.2